MKNYNCDFLIAGGGMVGLAIASQLINRKISRNIVIIDKEIKLGMHSSGRNSGVLHAGIYYEPDSLKAKVCISGAKRLKEWIKNRGLSINNCGKLIIPQKLSLDSQLDILYERGIKNGAKVELIDSREIAKIAPYANITSGRGLWSPNTSVVNPLEIINELKKEIQNKDVKILYSLKNIIPNEKLDCVEVDRKIKIKYGHFINATGLQADKIAKNFNVGLDYKIIPFKGIYWKLRDNCPINVNLNLYPVPDLNIPFLGVHFTPNCLNNLVNIGPTAIPAFGRENYRFFENVEPQNAIFDISFLAKQYLNDEDGFRKYVNEQAFLGFPFLFLKSAQELIPNLKFNHLEPSNKVGIRAQLFNLKTKKIVKDFLCLNGVNSTHILSAISPAFTGSFAFADLIIDNYLFQNKK